MISDQVNTPTSSNSDAPKDLVELGRIVGAYGIQGWIRIHSYSSDSSTLLNARHWWLKPPVSKVEAGGFALPRQVAVTHSRVHSDAIVAKLADIPDRTQAEALKAGTVWVSRAEFSHLEPDEYYWVDLVGCRLYGDDDGQQVLLGQVAGVLDNGAHGVLRVERATEGVDGQLEFQNDAKGRRRETLVPFVSAHVHTVDLENKQLLSNWPLE